MAGFEFLIFLYLNVVNFQLNFPFRDML